MRAGSLPALDPQALAASLRGAWRSAPPPQDLSVAQLDALIPGLIAGGMAALVRRRLDRTEYPVGGSTRELEAAARLQRASSLVAEVQLGRVMAALRAGGVDAMLLKGWSVARLYADSTLRPPGDIDLLVEPERRKLAGRILAAFPPGQVDVHDSLPGVDSLPYEELWRHSRVALLGDEPIRVLSPEHQLAHLCLHFMRHGGWRPLWLCDIALLLETLPAGFEWERCLAAEKRWTNCIPSSIALARDLLGAETVALPPRLRSWKLPRWLPRSILRQWSLPYPICHGVLVHQIPMSAQARHPAGLPASLVRRWPDPVSASVGLGAPLNGLPRLPFQLLHTARRSAAFVSEQARPWSHR